jgi:hypothetical protein
VYILVLASAIGSGRALKDEEMYSQATGARLGWSTAACLNSCAFLFHPIGKEAAVLFLEMSSIQFWFDYLGRQ